MNCPCHSGQSFDQCCGQFITHRRLPENALLLMRSRYSAYALRDEKYLLATWQAGQRPQSLELQPDIHWTGLRIIDFKPDGDSARVEFEASLMQDGRVSAMHENSRFIREQGKWLYTNGDSLRPSFEAWKPGRNDSCPCGSGRKFKRCCAAT